MADISEKQTDLIKRPLRTKADKIRQPALGSAPMSAVNLAEVLTKLGDRGVPQAEQRMIRTELGI